MGFWGFGEQYVMFFDLGSFSIAQTHGERRGNYTHIIYAFIHVYV
jgi:hypothetical protein